MKARISVAKADFEQQKELIKEAMNNEYLDFAKNIALEAGKIMLKYFEMRDIESYKEDNTIVTLVDMEINEYLIKEVKEKYPIHSVDGEEKSFGQSDHVWVCDPVDGTSMFARGIPTAVFSLALVIDGKSTVGVVNDPFTNNLYYAASGLGAYKNNTKISVNNIALDDMKSVSNFDNWPEAVYNLYESITKLGKKTYFVSIGSVIRACMAVADGKFNLAMFPGTKRKNCDMAAVKIIVEEAGGKVTDLFGNDQRYDQDINGAVVSNGLVHTEVIEVTTSLLKKD